MAGYARGSRALGECDRCGFTYLLSELKPQYINRMESGLLVCGVCRDIDHEQLRTDLLRTADPLTLRNPRPDRGLADSRGLSGWNPVLGIQATVLLGSC